MKIRIACIVANGAKLRSKYNTIHGYFRVLDHNLAKISNLLYALQTSVPFPPQYAVIYTVERHNAVVFTVLIILQQSHFIELLQSLAK